MSITGKVIGGLIGLLIGGPHFLLVGIFVGHLYDMRHAAYPHQRQPFQQGAQNTIQTLFFDTTFSVMGHLAKSDGRVTQNEIQTAERLMSEMNLSPSMRQEAIQFFEQGKADNFNLAAALQQLKRLCRMRPTLLRFFIETQIQIAYADGQTISPKKRAVLDDICRQLGLNGATFNQDYRNQYHHQYNHRQQNAHPSHYQLTEAYGVLGVTASDTDAEIKKAYRRKMSEHHPDKLIAKGLPPEMIKMATQKTQQIKQAFEQICKSRL